MSEEGRVGDGERRRRGDAGRGGEERRGDRETGGKPLIFSI